MECDTLGAVSLMTTKQLTGTPELSPCPQNRVPLNLAEVEGVRAPSPKCALDWSLEILLGEKIIRK